VTALDDYELVLHKIRAKLYPNHLQNVEGQYIARTDNERTLTTRDICTTLKTRGGFPGNVDELMEYINWYHAEEMYQVCDGYAVTNGWYTMYPNIGGSYESPHDAHDPEKHKISFRVSARKKLRGIAKNISVEITGVADTNGFIDYLVDQEEDDIAHNMFVPGDMVAVYGSKIKVAGDHPDNGVYFVPVDDPSQAVKMGRVGENNPTKITGIAPDTPYDRLRIEIRTQFTGATDKFLKEPRVIASAFVLEHL
jgi:hypothetical protein